MYYFWIEFHCKMNSFPELCFWQNSIMKMRPILHTHSLILRSKLHLCTFRCSWLFWIENPTLNGILLHCFLTSIISYMNFKNLIFIPTLGILYKSDSMGAGSVTNQWLVACIPMSKLSKGNEPKSDLIQGEINTICSIPFWNCVSILLLSLKVAKY